MYANIVVMGTESVGKSALTVRFLTRKFIGEYGDIESIYSHCSVVDGKEITLNVWDSPYSEDLSVGTSLFEKKVQWADGFILVYSVCDRASFNSVGRLALALRSAAGHNKSPPPPVVIVGNKKDLGHRRTVPGEEGRLLALRTGCRFCETSAADDPHSVTGAFHGLLDALRDAKMAAGAGKRPLGLKGIVKSVSAVFARRRIDSF